MFNLSAHITLHYGALRHASPQSFKNSQDSSSHHDPLFAGNLTKHMKSKAHSKKCLEMGVPELLIEDQDAEDSGTERQKKKKNQLLLYSKLINSQGSNVLFS